MHLLAFHYYFSHFLNWGIPRKLTSSLITFLKNHESQSKKIARLDRSKLGNISAAFTPPVLIFCSNQCNFRHRKSISLQIVLRFHVVGAMTFVWCIVYFPSKTREKRPSENFSFSIYPEKHMHHLLETRAMLEPSQGHVMFFLSWSGYRQFPVSGVWIEEMGRWRERSGKKGRDQGCLPFTQTTRVEILCINTKL